MSALRLIVVFSFFVLRSLDLPNYLGIWGAIVTFWFGNRTLNRGR